MGKSVKTFGPGRAEFIGNHTDYNNGFVVPVTLDAGTNGYGSFLDSKKINLHSRGFESATDIHLDILQKSPQEIRDLFKHNPKIEWIKYPLGIAKVLYDDGLLHLDHGFELIYDANSNFPIGSGLAASASIGITTYNLLCGLFPFEDTLKDAVLRCQRGEHGVPKGDCGNMDQFSSLAGYFQLFDAENVEGEKITPRYDIKIGILNTHVKHTIAPTGENVATAYSERRQQCFDAAKYLGVKNLRDVTENQLNSARKSGMDSMLYRRAYHVAGENRRAIEMKIILDSDMPVVGSSARIFKLMDESQQSSRYMFENSCPELDIMTAACNIHGLPARLSGGGFGGVVVVPCYTGQDKRLSEAAETYMQLAKNAKLDVREPSIYVFRPGPGAYRQFKIEQT
jgi:galactokinase